MPYKWVDFWLNAPGRVDSFVVHRNGDPRADESRQKDTCIPFWLAVGRRQSADVTYSSVWATEVCPGGGYVTWEIRRPQQQPEYVYRGYRSYGAAFEAAGMYNAQSERSLHLIRDSAGQLVSADVRPSVNNPRAPFPIEPPPPYCWLLSNEPHLARHNRPNTL